MVEEATKSGEATGRLIFEILRLAGRLSLAGDELVNCLGLSSARWQVLAMAAFPEDPQTVSQIARSLGLTRQSVQRVVNELATSGFVDMAENSAHKRARLVTVTAKGRKVLERAEALRIPWTEAIAVHLRGLDIENAKAVMLRLREALETGKSPRAGQPDEQ